MHTTYFCRKTGKKTFRERKYWKIHSLWESPGDGLSSGACPGSAGVHLVWVPAGRGEDLGLCYMLLVWKNLWLHQAELTGVRWGTLQTWRVGDISLNAAWRETEFSFLSPEGICGDKIPLAGQEWVKSSWLCTHHRYICSGGQGFLTTTPSYLMATAKEQINGQLKLLIGAFKTFSHAAGLAQLFSSMAMDRHLYRAHEMILI